MTGFLEGIIPPVVTPFEADGRLDLAGYEANIESYAACDFSGILVLGSNGEAAFTDTGATNYRQRYYRARLK